VFRGNFVDTILYFFYLNLACVSIQWFLICSFEVSELETQTDLQYLLPNQIYLLSILTFFYIMKKPTKFISPNHNFSYSKTTTELYSKLKTLEDRTHVPLEFEAFS